MSGAAVADGSRPAEDHAPPATAPRRWLVSVLLCMAALELAWRLTGAPGLRAPSWMAMGLVIVVAARDLGLREAYLLSVSGVLGAAVLMLAPAPGPALAAALDQAGFLMAFILLLGLLHEAAGSSPSVSELGRHLTRQPPGRRFYALFAGTGGMAVLFNMGIISFLVPLIQRGIAGGTPDDPLNPIRERRQISAMLRGFAWSVIWSPTAVAPLAVAALIPGTERGRWMVLGLGIYGVVMLIGACEDRWRFRRYRPSGRRVHAGFAARPALLFAAACAWLLGMTTLVAWATGTTVILGLMVASPLMLLGWLSAQYLGPGGAGRAALAGRLRRVIGTELPKSAPLAVTLAASGFIGRAGAELIPTEQLADFLKLDAIPDYLLLSALPVVIAVLSLLALSPIMTAIFFGSLFGSLPVLPTDPTLLALSISCGWALSMTFSPFATIVLLMQRVGGLGPVLVTWRWNIVFTTLAALALVPIFALLTGGR